MKTKLLPVFVLLVLVSCGSRKKELDKQTSETKTITNTDLQQSSTFNNQTKITTDLSKILSDKGLKITSNGQPYQLKYGDLIFSGSADVELSEKKENTKIQYKYLNHTTYQKKITYKTHTTYKSATKYKNLKIDRKAYPFWVFILIGFLGNILLKFLWNTFKKSTWHLSIWEQLNKKR